MISSTEPWFGVHVLLNTGRDAQALVGVLPALRQLGVNSLVAEINYNYAFESHPELRGDDPLGKGDSQGMVAACRAEGIRLIPQFQCFGHQSWAERTFSLLTRYPDMDETPGQFPGNKGIYCRSWCPRHPQVNPMVFDLFDELLEVFEADAMHVGMDEIFLIASEHCPRCRGAETSAIFAEAVNAYYDHLVKRRGVQMMMWGDRLLDAAETGYGEWEAAENGTHAALALIPKDIILCDWHYTVRETYPSIPKFAKEGFQVWPAGWRDVAAVETLLDYAQRLAGKGKTSYLCTTWGAVALHTLGSWAPLVTAARKLGLHPAA